jgi:hypothetical protein
MTDSGGVSAATLQHIDDFDELLAAPGLVGAASDGSLDYRPGWRR